MSSCLICENGVVFLGTQNGLGCINGYHVKWMEYELTSLPLESASCLTFLGVHTGRELAVIDKLSCIQCTFVLIYDNSLS